MLKIKLERRKLAKKHSSANTQNKKIGKKTKQITNHGPE